MRYVKTISALMDCGELVIAHNQKKKRERKKKEEEEWNANERKASTIGAGRFISLRCARKN